MKKDKYDIKSSLQSWLIALICCIVVIGATVCGIVFGMVPMQVAKADVEVSTIYIPIESFVPLVNDVSVTQSCSGTVNLFSNQLSFNFDYITLFADPYSASLELGMSTGNRWRIIIDYYYDSLSQKYQFSVSQLYRDNIDWNAETRENTQFTFIVLPTLTADADTLLSQIAYSFVVDHTPDILLNDIKTIHFNYSGLQFTQQSANRTFTLYGYKVANAGDYTNQVGNCFVSVKYITYGEDPITISINQVMLNRLNDGYYLILTCPDSIERIQVAFQGYTDWFTIEYDVYDYVGLFITNYENIRAIENEGRSIGYSTGYSEGYVAGTTEKNNLLSVMWSTFELPFTLLFGHYDDDQFSLTYGQYVGGLFNFTILGLDVRAFVLGLMSLIILVGISRFILGAFHIGG